MYIGVYLWTEMCLFDEDIARKYQILRRHQVPWLCLIQLNIIVKAFEIIHLKIGTLMMSMFMYVWYKHELMFK